MDANFFNRVGGKSIGEVSANFVVRAPLTPNTVAWWDKFVKLYNRPPVYTAPGAYDAVYIYAEAVKRAGGTEPDKVIKELEKTNYVGVRGRVQFDETHDVKDGPGFVDQRRHVYRADVSVGQLNSVNAVVAHSQKSPTREQAMMEFKAQWLSLAS